MLIEVFIITIKYIRYLYYLKKYRNYRTFSFTNINGSFSDTGTYLCNVKKKKSNRYILKKKKKVYFFSFVRSQRNKVGMSVSHPQLSYMNGCGTGNVSGQTKRSRDVATQTPESISAETRRARLRPLKLTLTAPNSITLR